MGEYASFASLDPSTGALIASVVPDAHGSAAEAWNPAGDLVSSDPHDDGYGDEATLGPTPCNIIGERSLRAFGFDGDEDTIGDEGGSIDPDDLDGDCDPQDGDCSDDSEDDDDTGPVADNIVVDQRGLLGGMGVVPGPMTRSRL